MKVISNINPKSKGYKLSHDTEVKQTKSNKLYINKTTTKQKHMNAKYKTLVYTNILNRISRKILYFKC